MGMTKRLFTVFTSALLIVCLVLPLSGCEKAHVHSYGEWAVETPATCTAEGTEKRTCTICGAFETRKLDKLAHEYGEWAEETPATCKVQGTEKRTCKHCDAFETRKTDLAEHKYGEWAVETPATCKVQGTEKRTCSECDAFETRKTGLAEHKYGEWAVDEPPTCTSVGTEKRTCSECGAFETRAGSSTSGHNYDRYGFDENGHWRECGNCGARIDESGHVYPAGTNKCGTCGYVDSSPFTFEKDDAAQEYTLTYFKLDSRTITAPVIPDTYLGLPVVAIGTNAFTTPGSAGHLATDDRLKSVTFGKNLRRIDFQAFWGDTGLTEITVPESVTYIGQWAFSTCTGLKNVTIDGDAELVESCFMDCTDLESVTFNGDAAIGQWSFSRCTGLQSITLNGKTKIGKWVFYGCTKLQTAEINNDIELVESSFMDCTGLESVTFNGNATIGQWSFSRCTGLQSVTVNGKSKIGNEAFYGCKQLKTLTINDDCEIGANAFVYCASLVSAAIKGKSKIGEWAFCYCSELQNVTVSDDLIACEKGAFYDCNKLNFTTHNNVHYLGCDDNPYVMAVSTADSGAAGALHQDTRVIGENAFRDAAIASLDIPATVRYIGVSAFYDCPSLSTVTFLGGGCTIAENAFKCSPITRVNVSSLADWLSISFVKSVENVFDGNPLQDGAGLYINGELLSGRLDVTEGTKIGRYAFSGYDKLTSVNIGAQVTEVEPCAFLNCSQLATITVGIGNAAFRAENNCLIKKDGSVLLVGTKNSATVPSGVVEIAEYAFCNTSFAADTDICIPDSVERIGAWAYGMTLINITVGTIRMSANIKYCGEGAFANCIPDAVRIENLAGWCEVEFADASANPISQHKDVFVGDVNVTKYDSKLVIPEGVTRIREWAFYTARIFTLSLPASVENIASNAFGWCGSLTAIELDDGNSRYEMYDGLGLADADTHVLTVGIGTGSVVVPDGIVGIADHAFSNRNINSVKLADSVLEVGNNAFEGTYVQTLDLGSGVQHIGDFAFDGCKLSSVVLPASLEYIGYNAFLANNITSAVFLGSTGWYYADPTRTYETAFTPGSESYNAQLLVSGGNIWYKK